MTTYKPENITLNSHQTSWLDFTGPLKPAIKFLVTTLSVLTLFRLGLIIWQWSRVDAVDGFGRILLFGLRVDVILVSYLLIPVVLTLILLPRHISQGDTWRKIYSAWLSFWLVFIVFMETATPPFVLQYDLRPNRIFFEYLNHPVEVALTLWGGFKIHLLAAFIISTLAVFLTRKIFRTTPVTGHYWSIKKRLIILPLVFILLIFGGRSSFDHRPANASSVAFSGDHLVNELGLNSAYSVMFAIYRLKDEKDASSIYPKMPEEEIGQRMRHEMMLPPSAFISDTFKTLHRQHPLANRQKPMNLVIILEESLGAQYVKSLGGEDYTPELDKLANQGIWFDQLYATGTRSVRGIEAVVTGFFPTPARSVVKLGLSQNQFFTIASLLKTAGYTSDFIYGGEGQFDNMGSFFLANGFDRVIDEDSFDNPNFRGSWGVSDGDLFRRADEEFTRHGDKPFFALVFTSSNHTPYDIPDSPAKTDPAAPLLANAIRYADYALGEFIIQARASSYWDNTLFLIVADHDDRVYGPSLIPIEHFHIPGLILGGGIQPKVVEKIASQADLPPTLLSLMGLTSEHPMPGLDLTQLPEMFPGRAIMQYGTTHAYMRGEQVVIHALGKTGEQFTYSDGILHPAEVPNQELIKDALATALWPSLTYRQQKYPSAEIIGGILPLNVKDHLAGITPSSQAIGN